MSMVGMWYEYELKDIHLLIEYELDFICYVILNCYMYICELLYKDLMFE